MENLKLAFHISIIFCIIYVPFTHITLQYIHTFINYMIRNVNIRFEQIECRFWIVIMSAKVAAV